MKEYVTYEDNDYLTHWGIGKGGKKEGSKYIARVEVNGKYRYFYTPEEYNAYLKGEQKKGELKRDFNKLKKNVKKDLKKLKKDPEKFLKKKTKEVKKEVKELKENIAEKAPIYAEKGKNFIDNLLKTANDVGSKAVDAVSRTYESGKNYVKDAVGVDEREALKKATSDRIYKQAKLDSKIDTEYKKADAKNAARQEMNNAKKHRDSVNKMSRSDETAGTGRPSATPAKKIREEASKNQYEATKKYLNAKNEYETSLKKKSRVAADYHDAVDKESEARNAYDKTVLGRIDKAKTNIRVKRSGKKKQTNRNTRKYSTRDLIGY